MSETSLLMVIIILLILGIFYMQIYDDDEPVIITQKEYVPYHQPEYIHTRPYRDFPRRFYNRPYRRRMYDRPRKRKSLRNRDPRGPP